MHCAVKSGWVRLMRRGVDRRRPVYGAPGLIEALDGRRTSGILDAVEHSHLRVPTRDGRADREFGLHRWVQSAGALREQHRALPPRVGVGVPPDDRDALLLQVRHAGAHRQRIEVADEGDDVVLGDLLFDLGDAGRGVTAVVREVDVDGVPVEPAVRVDVVLPHAEGRLGAGEHRADDTAVAADVAQVDGGPAGCACVRARATSRRRRGVL